MINFEKKKKIRDFFKSTPLLILLLVAFFLLIKAMYGVYIKETVSNDNLIKERTEFQKMSSRKEMLTQAIEYLKTDDGVESEIRSKYRMVKDGESIVVIVENNKSTSTSPTTTNFQEKGGFFSSLMRAFGGD